MPIDNLIAKYGKPDAYKIENAIKKKRRPKQERSGLSTVYDNRPDYLSDSEIRHQKNKRYRGMSKRLKTLAPEYKQQNKYKGVV